MGFKIYVIALLVFSVANLLFFVFKPIQYHLSLRTLRKALYTLFIGAISIGLLVNEIQMSNWQFILTLAIIVVFMDLAILLTPSILKIWNAEFQYTDYVEDIIKTNDKIQTATVYRVQAMSEIIQTRNGLFMNGTGILHINNSSSGLESYLREYANKFGFDVQVWELQRSDFTSNQLSGAERDGLSVEEIESLVEAYRLTEALYNVLDDIKNLNSFDYGEELDSHVEALAQSAVVSLIDNESMLVPVFMTDYDDFIVVLKNGRGEVLEVDAIHITNLVYLYYTLV
ncbi:type II toxin-antitoxin system SpoIISA family toxin [Cytobacillus oceanisediminis]|uniref:type II toxin-antitoxin system SpoIISA family toxin n=1 Tax=Cytobacillus oceanisediminis TaxID=665099 RepID=UPI002041809C|nr:type II toxin-antitoxin system SpoIISA family toxin [Cytobacillus oceanisediminis]MCM3393093.1 type II toxin-antitoxin system SpoIISA family toxin [Cytobacillus oceanisediminis]